MGRTRKVVARFSHERDRAEGAQRAAIEESFGREREEAVAKASAEIRERAEGYHQEMCEEARQRAREIVAAERQKAAQRLTSLLMPLDALEDSTQKGQSMQQRSQASSELSIALLSLHKALLEGRTPGAELMAVRAASKAGGCTGFTSRLLAKLSSETLALRGERPIPTVPQLTHSFTELLADLSATALAPPTGGLLATVLSHILGRTLSSLYVLNVAADRMPDAISGATATAQQNLIVLSRASCLVERGELRPAVQAL